MHVKSAARLVCKKIRTDVEGWSVHIAQIHAEPNNTQHRSRELLSFRFVMRYLPELALTSTVINLLALAVPITVTQIYDRIIPYQSYSTLGMLLGGVVVALVLDAALRIGRNYITGFIGSVFEHNLTCAASPYPGNPGSANVLGGAVALR